MIDVHNWATPNGYEMHIMLEGCELPYRVRGINIGANGQFKPDLPRISPNNGISVTVDQDGPDGEPILLLESGAILLYLAGKTGKFLPDDVCGRYEVLQRLISQMSDAGPILDQVHRFRIYAPEKIEYVINRYTNEVKCLYGVIGKRPDGSKLLGDPDYSIVDTAVWPWLRSQKNQGVKLSSFPKLQHWSEATEERPAVQCTVKMLAKGRPVVQDDKTGGIFLGATQYARC